MSNPLAEFEQDHFHPPAATRQPSWLEKQPEFLQKFVRDYAVHCFNKPKYEQPTVHRMACVLEEYVDQNLGKFEEKVIPVSRSTYQKCFVQLKKEYEQERDAELRKQREMHLRAMQQADEEDVEEAEF